MREASPRFRAQRTLCNPNVKKEACPCTILHGVLLPKSSLLFGNSNSQTLLGFLLDEISAAGEEAAPSRPCELDGAPTSRRTCRRRERRPPRPPVRPEAEGPARASEASGRRPDAGAATRRTGPGGSATTATPTAPPTAAGLPSRTSPRASSDRRRRGRRLRRSTRPAYPGCRPASPRATRSTTTGSFRPPGPRGSAGRGGRPSGER